MTLTVTFTFARLASGSTSKPSHSSLKATTQDPRFSFSGDAESDDEEEEGGEEEEEEGDKEDDMSVAFSVLDFARVLYEKSLEAADGPRLECLDGSVLGELEIKAELAEVLNDLGDVGLESGEFATMLWWNVHVCACALRRLSRGQN